MRVGKKKDCKSAPTPLVSPLLFLLSAGREKNEPAGSRRETMRDRRERNRLTALGLVLALAVAGTVQAGEDARLATLREAGSGASLTVYPFVLGESPMAEVGEVVGVMMEQSGLEDVGIDRTVFRPERDAGVEEIAEAFGAFVREKGIDRQYALYGEFRGTRAAGITEIRAFLVDREGNVVWADRKSPGDPAFDRANPNNPMECCVFVAERLKEVMALPDVAPGQDRQAGRLESELASRSGVPAESELEAMKKRQTAYADRFAAASLEVYPVRIQDELSREEAERLSGYLAERGFGGVEVGGTELHIEVKPDRNEQKMLWTLARQFREHVRAHPPLSEYVLFADYIMTPPDGPVGAVHIVVCDRKGEWVLVDYQNSHHRDFRKVKPEDAEGCGRLAARRMASYVR
jgi:hypothetical protein